jgi:molybdopterin-containing oxidoreductase family membrane subunit
VIDPELLEGTPSSASLDHQVTGAVLHHPIRFGWFSGIVLSFLLVNLLFVSITWLLIRGVGVWGVNIPVAWGFAIVNFVWWIGIGHAGTFISAILYVLHQEWRTSINRFAEAMTLFAVACAGLFPLLHLGRPWYFYWLLPYPDSMGLWPQWRSPLIWDVFAVMTYAIVSLVFWYVGMIPDLASLRDRAERRGLKKLYGLLALGWRGSSRHWARFETLYLILAALATPLVISVHSIVGMDFAAAQLPGWHSTIFPPYFVAGAIYSGFAMVLTLAIPLRRYYGLKNLITERHLDLCAKLLLVTGLLVGYGYFSENLMAWLRGDAFEKHIFTYRLLGRERFLYWILLFCNILVPQTLWSARIRRSSTWLFVIALLVNVGMWLERFVIVVTSLSQDFIASSWGTYTPTFWDIATFIGTLGLFFFLFLLFIRTAPAIALFELKELAHRKTTAKEAG